MVERNTSSKPASNLADTDWARDEFAHAPTRTTMAFSAEAGAAKAGNKGSATPAILA
jgi:hypothetical protein